MTFHDQSVLTATRRTFRQTHVCSFLTRHHDACDNTGLSYIALFQVWPQGIQCQLCPMTFSDQSAINAHYDTAHAQKSFRSERPDAKHPCEICCRKFTTPHWLRHHLSAVHGVGDVKTYKCDVCTRVFNQKSNLATHMKRKHAGRT